MSVRDTFRALRSQYRLGQRSEPTLHPGVPELACLNAWARPSYSRPLCDEARIAVTRRFGHRAATFLPRHQPTRRVSVPRYQWEIETHPMVDDHGNAVPPSPLQRRAARRALFLSLHSHRRLTYVELPA